MARTLQCNAWPLASPAAQALGAFSHIRDSRATHHARGPFAGTQADAIVFHRVHNLPVRHRQFRHNCRAAGVAGGIVEALLEHKEELPACLQTEEHILSGSRSQFELDPLAFQQVEAKFAHPPEQRVDTMRLGADGPDEVAHRIHQLAGQRGNPFQRLAAPPMAVAGDARDPHRFR